MNNKSITGLQIYAIISLGVFGITTLLSAGIFVYFWFFGGLLLMAIDIFGGSFSQEAQWIFILGLFAGYFLSSLALWIASIGMLLRQRWARILALICLPVILLISTYFSHHALSFLWTNFSTLEADWQMQTALLLLPVVMVLYSIWGLVQIGAGKLTQIDG